MLYIYCQNTLINDQLTDSVRERYEEHSNSIYNNQDRFKTPYNPSPLSNNMQVRVKPRTNLLPSPILISPSPIYVRKKNQESFKKKLLVIFIMITFYIVNSLISKSDFLLKETVQNKIVIFTSIVVVEVLINMFMLMFINNAESSTFLITSILLITHFYIAIVSINVGNVAENTQNQIVKEKLSVISKYISFINGLCVFCIILSALTVIFPNLLKLIIYVLLTSVTMIILFKYFHDEKEQIKSLIDKFISDLL